jgi:nucleolar protein 16
VPKKLQPGEAKIIRDESGAVIRIEHAPTAEEALDEDEWSCIADEGGDQQRTTDVVRQLEALAKSEVKVERTQSEREREWIEGLVAKHGRDYKKMARDRKLNPFQQTEGDIRRRIAKWEKKYDGKMQAET